MFFDDYFMLGVYYGFIFLGFFSILLLVYYIFIFGKNLREFYKKYKEVN